MDKEAYLSDAYPPQEIARMVERLGVAKARADTNNLIAMAWASRLGVPAYWWWNRGARGAP